MTPAARHQAAIEVLDAIVAGEPAERVLTNWGRTNRFAGSGDRAALRDIVFAVLRRMRSCAALGGGRDGRSLVLGLLRQSGTDPATIFTGARHAPAVIDGSGHASRAMTRAEALDCPDWLLPVFEQSVGDGADAVLMALRDRAPVTLRVNRLRGTVADAVASLAGEGVGTVVVPGVTTALRVEVQPRKVQAAQAFGGGLVELQDASSQAAVELVPLTTGQSLLDYCAGGGGKALAFAARGARVTAHDIDPRRMADIPARAERAGARIEVTAPADLRRERAFDLVFVDAPCSGSGTWRRTPEAKWALTPARLAALTAIQSDVLLQAAGHVRRGGVLAYATCSVFQPENGACVADFLAARPDFALTAEKCFLPDEWGDGFYIAVMEKQA